MENIFNDFSEVEIKKTQIVLDIEYIPCKKCGNPINLSKWIPPDEGDKYYQGYVCSSPKCEEFYVIKKHGPIYPRFYSINPEKEITCELSYNMIHFLQKFIGEEELVENVQEEQKK